MTYIPSVVKDTNILTRQACAPIQTLILKILGGVVVGDPRFAVVRLQRVVRRAPQVNRIFGLLASLVSHSLTRPTLSPHHVTPQAHHQGE